jgi:hypothetical protein
MFVSKKTLTLIQLLAIEFIRSSIYGNRVECNILSFHTLRVNSLIAGKSNYFDGLAHILIGNFNGDCLILGYNGRMYHKANLTNHQIYTAKLSPQPQLRLALGLIK